MVNKIIEERKQLALEKNLIIENDYTNYRKILNLYKYGFEEILNQIINFEYIDKIIEESNLYFTNSITAQKKFPNSNLKSKYFYCLNQFYVEKLSQADIDILNQTTSLNKQTLNIIKNTFNNVITKPKVKNITYGYSEPTRIIKNKTIVLELFIGKTNINNKKLYLEIRKQQHELIDKVIKEIENKLKIYLNTEVKILISKEF